MPRSRLLAAASVALLASACSSATPSASSTTTTRPIASTTTPTAGSPSTTTSTTTLAASSLSWQPCGGGRQCATLAVPLDATDANAGTIDLALVRVPAKDQAHRIGSLLVDPGGPGGSGVDFVKSGFSFGDTVSDRFDLVGFDPRGVGASSPLHCGDHVDAFLAVDSAPDDPTEQQQLDDAAKAVADECGAEDAGLLGHIGTDDVVGDMERIRIALGEQQISYLGFSYGTLLGERYAERFPTSARAIVLDGVVDPADDFEGFLRGQTVALERTMAAVFASIGDGARKYDEVAAKVEQAPLDGVGPSELATAAIFVTYDPTTWEDLGRALDDALGGDGAALGALAATYREFGGFTTYAGIECIDSPHPEGAAAYTAFADELAGLSPRFGAAVANELLPCAFWPAPPVGRPADVHAAGAPPILVIGNTGDAATPYEQAVKVAKVLDDGRLLTYEGQGHTSYGASDCVDQAVEDYLVDLTLPPDGTVCTS